MDVSLTQRAEKTVACAAEEAAKRGQKHVMPEHLLLALLREGDTDAARVLAYRGIARGELQEALESRMEAVGEAFAGATNIAPRSALALERARAEAESFGFGFTGTEHLLIGLIAERNSLAARLLARQNLTLESAREAVIEALWDGRDIRIQSAAPRKIPLPSTLYLPELAAAREELKRAIVVIDAAEEWGWNNLAPALEISAGAAFTLFLLLRSLLSFSNGTPMALLDIVLLCLSIGAAINRVHSRKREYEAAKVAINSTSQSAIRPLIRTMRWNDRQIRVGSQAALTRLLPTLRTGAAAILTPNDRITLGRQLQSHSIQKNPLFAVAILTAFERVGSGDSVYYVKPLTLRTPKTEAETQIYEAANRCLRALEWRAAHQDAHWTLLRPSNSSADSPDILLRPASAAGTIDPAMSLRSASAPQTDSQGNSPAPESQKELK